LSNQRCITVFYFVISTIRVKWKTTTIWRSYFFKAECSLQSYCCIFSFQCPNCNSAYWVLDNVDKPNWA